MYLVMSQGSPAVILNDSRAILWHFFLSIIVCPAAYGIRVIVDELQFYHYDGFSRACRRYYHFGGNDKKYLY